MAERAFSVRRMPGFTPVAILVFVLLYAPIAILATYSFNAGTSIAIWEGFSLRWYRRRGRTPTCRPRPSARSASP